MRSKRRNTIPRCGRWCSPARATSRSAPGPTSRPSHGGRTCITPTIPNGASPATCVTSSTNPTIAAVNGTVLGGGTELALASDLVVADERAQFGLPEVKCGLIAAAGGVFRIAEQLPRKVAMRLLLLTGEPLSAAAARDWGLINEVVESGSVLDAALALASAITVNAPLLVQASKRIAYGVDDGMVVDDEPGWDRTMREMRVLLKSEDAKEGPRAFAEKREPVWKVR